MGERRERRRDEDALWDLITSMLCVSKTTSDEVASMQRQPQSRYREGTTYRWIAQGHSFRTELVSSEFSLPRLRHLHVAYHEQQQQQDIMVASVDLAAELNRV